MTDITGCLRALLRLDTVVYSRLGFEGVNCEVDIDECAASVCQNGGLCNQYNNTYTFKCYCDATFYYVGKYEVGGCGYELGG